MVLSSNTNQRHTKLRLKKLGIDSYKEAVLYLHHYHRNSIAEALGHKSQIHVTLRKKSLPITVNFVSSNLLNNNQASLSDYAWSTLGAKEDDKISIAHAPKPNSLKFLRSKIYGNYLEQNEIEQMVSDIALNNYSDIEMAAFLSACAGNRMTEKEIFYLAEAMVKAGNKLHWGKKMVVDKHCVGGLPGNRTTPIIVAIVSACGMTMPKTSSRSITSSSGSADTMEVLTNVELGIAKIKKVVAKEKACLAWGGTAGLSPVDDILINVERVLDLDSEGQMVASILSKKVAAGSTHVLIDIPIGKTAKVRSKESAEQLKKILVKTGKKLGLKIETIFTDGSQPVGCGIGPALEARDLLAVLKNDKNAPQDLRNRALILAAKILEFSPRIKKGHGLALAEETLNSGAAWQKFQAICKAQGGLKKIPQAQQIQKISAQKTGKVVEIDNRRMSFIAKLAGAPIEKTAGIDLHVKIGDKVKKGEAIFSIHASSPETMQYAREYFNIHHNIIEIL